MNAKRLVLAIVVVFVGVFATDYLIHRVWLKTTYEATMNLWRTEPEMKARMGWLFLGEFLASATFVVIWSKGFPATASLGGACLYGGFMGLFSQTATLVGYAVQPFPPELAVKWFIAGIAQGVLMGVLVFLVGKPKPAEGRP